MDQFIDGIFQNIKCSKIFKVEVSFSSGPAQQAHTPCEGNTLTISVSKNMIYFMNNIKAITLIANPRGFSSVSTGCCKPTSLD